MMERRLQVARELLNPTSSVLIATIDEKEFLRLGLLLEQVFPEAKMQMVSSVINPAGAGRTAEFARTDEYIFFCRFGNAKVAPEDRQLEDVPVVWDTLRRSSLAGARGKKGKGACGPNQFFPIYVQAKTGWIAEIGEPLPEFVKVEDAPQRSGMVAVLPIRPDGTEMNWGVTPDVAKRLLKDGHLRAGKHTKNSPQPYVISYLTGGIVRDIGLGKVVVTGRRPDGSIEAHYPTGKEKMPTTNWNRASHDAQRYGTEVVKALIGRNFPYPKSLYAVEDCLSFFLLEKPEATLLDFFAGSGTTAHAVMKLNKRLGHRLKSISITNNEVDVSEQFALRRKNLRPGDSEWESLGICDYITKPRIDAAISGLTPQGSEIEGDYTFTDEFPMAEGFEENAEFFTLTYETPVAVSHNRAFERISPLLWMRAGSEGKRIDELPAHGWAVADTYGLLTDLDMAGPFCAAVTDRGSIRVAFIVTDDERRFQAVARQLPKGVDAVRLYESYLTNFRFSMGR
jgi:adenine-specific DNA-methyltransferase